MDTEALLKNSQFFNGLMDEIADKNGADWFHCEVIDILDKIKESIDARIFMYQKDLTKNRGNDQLYNLIYGQIVALQGIRQLIYRKSSADETV